MGLYSSLNTCLLFAKNGLINTQFMQESNHQKHAEEESRKSAKCKSFKLSSPFVANYLFVCASP